MPLFSGLVDVVQSVSGRNSSLGALNTATNVVHTLASKVLQTPLFIAMKWLLSGIQLAKIFHLVGRILEGKASHLLQL